MLEIKSQHLTWGGPKFWWHALVIKQTCQHLNSLNCIVYKVTIIHYMLNAFYVKKLRPSPGGDSYF